MGERFVDAGGKMHWVMKGWRCCCGGWLWRYIGCVGAGLLLWFVEVRSQSPAPPFPVYRYRQALFSQVQVIPDVQYGEAPAWYFPFPMVQLYVDIFLPVGDTLTKRPLIIFAHSGGFLTGNRKVDNMYALCDTFARMGYVTATMSYRLGYNPLDASSAERAVYRGIQDGKAAVRFFKEFASTYGIDTNYIIMAGASAGGFIALHCAYVDKESERPASSYLWPDLGCLDCSGNTYNHSSRIFAAVNMWGALGDTLFIESPQDPPAILFHSYHDQTVPYGYDHPFGLSTLPRTYGSGPTAERLAHVGVPYELHPSNTNMHMLDGSNNGDWDSVQYSPSPYYYDTLIPRMVDFLYRLMKPRTERLSPETLYFCGPDTFGWFAVQGSGSGSYFWWWVEPGGGAQLLGSAGASSMYIYFTRADTFHVYVQEFNRIRVAGDTLAFYVVVDTPLVPQIQFLGWTDSGEWVGMVQVVGADSIVWHIDQDIYVPDADTLRYRLDTGVHVIRVWAFRRGGCWGVDSMLVVVQGGGSDSSGGVVTGVRPLVYGEGKVWIWVVGGGLMVQKPAEEEVLVYSGGGRLVGHCGLGDRMCRVGLPARGVYYLWVGGRGYRVVW